MVEGEWRKENGERIGYLIFMNLFSIDSSKFN